MADETSRLTGIEAFRDLPAETLAEIDSRLRLIEIARGETLIRQGEEADALYMVVSGRFDVHIAARGAPIAQIGPGSPIGEIAFFAGGRRTATVMAARDSQVLELSREDFDSLTQRSPRIWSTVTAALARRLAATNAGAREVALQSPRTIALIHAGAASIVDRVLPELIAQLSALARVRTITAGAITTPLASGETTRWLNALEAESDHLVYVADPTLSAWSEKAIRQADWVIAIGDATAADRDTRPNALEEFASSLHAGQSLRLVLAHPVGTRRGSGTRAWLERRPKVGMHHHVATGAAEDFARLARFIAGRAVGLVACGGGAFTAAHIGIHEALIEAGVTIDMFGGTSGGSAMTAAFALGASPDEIERRSLDMFVTRRAMKRWTLPRYSLIDHMPFDAALEEHFSAIDIEDLWVPYFAASTNLTLNRLNIHRSGPLWEAIRASSAIPALLPPVFTPDGMTLVDGALLDNVPIGPMRQLKTGPNIVIHFEMPALPRCFVDHRELPSRRALMLASLTRAGRARLPRAPGPQAVLLHGLMMPRRALHDLIGAEDVLMSMTPPEGLTHLDWHAQGRIREAGRTFARCRLAELKRAAHPLLGPDPAFADGHERNGAAASSSRDPSPA